jgi:phage terminase small subunit
MQTELQKRSDISKDEAILELTNIVRSRVTDIMNVKGTRVVVKSLSDLPDNVTSSIASVKKVKGGIEVRFYDKIAAIDRLAKMLGWDKPTKIDMNATVSIKQITKEEAKDLLLELESKY